MSAIPQEDANWRDAGRGWETPPRVIAHRGASLEAPENTLAAFALAVDQGAPALELDVHLTADGVPVVIHDERVDRTTDGTGFVGDMDLADLRELDAGAWFDPAFAGERVPTLDEVLAAVGGRMLLDLELKTTHRAYPGLLDAVADVVAARGVARSVLVSSFNPETVRDARSMGMRTTLILPFVPTPEDLEAWGTAAEGLALFHGALDDEGIDLALAMGLPVWAWTVDDPARGRALLDAGLDGIITNGPSRFLPD